MNYTVLDIETTGSDPSRDALVAVGIGGNVYRPEEGRGMAARLMSRPGVVIVAHTNYDLRWLMMDGLRLADGVHYHDTKVMAWMLDAEQPLDLASLAQRYLGFTPPKPIKQVGGRIRFDGVPIEDVPWAEMEAYNRSDIETEAALYEYLRERLQALGLWEHFLMEEAPFSRLLVEMEAAGMPFDAEGAEDMLLHVETELAGLRAELIDCVGDPDFNPGSGDQVAAYLYEETYEVETRFAIPRLAGLTQDEKIMTVHDIKPKGVSRILRVGREYAYGTRAIDGRGLAEPVEKNKAYGKRATVNSKVLAVLHGEDPWVRDYLEWRRLDKLRGYLVDWIERTHEGRLHPRFDQSGTVTGRLSCRQPNLQQVSGESGVRDLFRGDLVVGDYAGLEVRISAHFSQDPVMLEIFRGGHDLYGTLAARAWVGPEDKTNEGRGLMKVLMLASQYGARGNKVAEILAIAGMTGYTVRKAVALLKDLENTLPRLFEWREEVIREATRSGYVTTIGNRKRFLADIKSRDWGIKAKAERQAVNSLVQGSAADIVRRAMLRCRDALAPDMARIILQVHDEILWERGPAWQDNFFPYLVDICQNGTGFELDVPLVFEAKVADSWAAKGGSGGQVATGAYATLNESLQS